jgi:hypothetical protein
MNRKGPLLIIAGLALVAAVASIFKLQATKRQHPSDSAAGTAQALGDRRPFRSAVVELTFRSKSLHEGEEYLSATGHRTEYIDAAGGRRREDYERIVTTMRQSTSTEALTLIFDGTNLYTVTSNNGTRAGHVTDLREGYDYTIWEDAAAEKLHVPGATVSEQEFLGRPCKVYSISPGKTVQKWWVWNGITLRSESHFGDATTVQDTTEEAVRVEEDVEMDPGLFTMPADVTFEPVKPTVAEQLNHHKSAPWVRMKPETAIF